MVPDGEISDGEIPDNELPDGEIPDSDSQNLEHLVTEQSQSFPGAFCEPCNKWREPNALLSDGSCPRCGTQLDAHAEEAAQAASAEAAATVKIPWHFWVMVAATALYLGWRVIQGLQSLF